MFWIHNKLLKRPGFYTLKNNKFIITPQLKVSIAVGGNVAHLVGPSLSPSKMWVLNKFSVTWRHNFVVTSEMLDLTLYKYMNNGWNPSVLWNEVVYPIIHFTRAWWSIWSSIVDVVYIVSLLSDYAVPLLFRQLCDLTSFNTSIPAEKLD